MDNVFFLYDMSMIRFIANHKNSDFETTMYSLEDASYHFLWYFRNLKSNRDLLGYDLSLIDGKFKLDLAFTGLNVEFRAPWIHQLGTILERYYDFDLPLFVSYEDLGHFKEMVNSL